MTSSMESETDVLIIGAGPSGLMAATWLAKCGVRVRIIDRRATKVFKGQADSLQVRTMEIFDSFGMAHNIDRDGAHLLETRFWTSSEEGGIYPVGVIPEYYPSLSRFHQVLINQGRVERNFLDAIEDFGGVKVDRGVQPISLDIDHSKVEDFQTYAVKVAIQHLTKEELLSSPWSLPIPKKGDFNINPGDEIGSNEKVSDRAGTTEVIHAKYVIGCDGASSWTRKQVGLRLEGDGNDPLWGAMDICPVTDFPDTRIRAVVNSPRGSMLFVPRESGMVRIGVKLDMLDRTQVTPETILAAARHIIAPFRLDYTHCDWYAVYQSNQRLADHFTVKDRVMICGDACHTHSPKAGIGMNFSIQDSYNLGWKIAHVVKGIAKPSLLRTYELERRETALKLIEFDLEFTKKLSDTADNKVHQTQKAFYDALPFTSCTSIEYSGNMIVAKSSDNVKSKPELARNLVIGRRFPSQKVINQSNGQPLEFQERLISDGKYRILVFGGDISTPTQSRRVEEFARALDAHGSFFQKSLTKHGFSETPFEVILLHRAKRHDVELSKVHEIFHRTGVPYVDAHDRVYVDQVPFSTEAGYAYEGFGVDHTQGCIVTVRPDQVIMHIGDLEDVDELNTLFGGILA